MKLTIIIIIAWLCGFASGFKAAGMFYKSRLLKLIGTGRLLITSGYSADSLKRLYEEREKEWHKANDKQT